MTPAGIRYIRLTSQHANRKPVAIQAISSAAQAVSSQLNLQGNRISKQSQELGEICVIPSGAFELAAQGSFGGILLHHVQRHVSQHREVVWPVVQSAPVLILVHYDIEPPV